MSSLTVRDITSEPSADHRIQQVEEIFEEHYALTYRTAYAILGRAEDAEDVVQSIFLGLLRRDTSPDLKKNPAGYLYRAAVNSSLNSIRGEKRRVRAMDHSVGESRPSTDCDAAEEQNRRLYDAVAQLAPDAANMLILRYTHNYSDAQIAKLLGMSRAAVAVRLFRSRARLRKLMEAGHESPQ
jgi:RNA polymerase sigma-70 factor (ECF subfamily)